MAKVSGSYESVVRGVSEQVAQDRLSGQHWEQVNMVPDPVRGLARRHGSVTVAEASLPHVWADLLANTASHRAFTFSSAGVTYDLLYRTGTRVSSSGVQDGFFCFDRTNKVFLPVVIDASIATAALANGGVSAITQLGKFVVMAGNTYTTTWSTVERYNVATNLSKLAVWIRGGGYSRTYTVTFTDKTTLVKYPISYTTKQSSYPTLLDTSSILTSNPDYQKLVNDMVYAYNSEVTKWIGTAAADITPENIAAKLAAAYTAAGLGSATVNGSTLLIDDTRWSEVTVNDGGDGSLAKAVGNVAQAAEDMCPVHWVGKVVKIRPSKESPETAYYLRAYAKDDTSTGQTEVTWKEGAFSETTPARMFVLATVSGGTVYISSSPDYLETVLGASPDDVPQYPTSLVGDAISNPLPHFMGKSIDLLTTFQDRLVVGSGATLSMSRSKDYFNFSRTSVLTILDSDPVEEFALGAEEDTIRHATPFNRNLILYGKLGQYIISGQQPVTPNTASITSALSKYENGIDAVPKTSGNLAFYAAKRGPEDHRTTSLQQIQPAALSDIPVSQDVAQQLDDYLKGTAIELVTLTKPNTVVMRTDSTRNGMYLYNYLDRSASGERLLDAWHRWEWGPQVGHVVGMVPSGDGSLLVYLVRRDASGTAWIACEQFSLVSAVSKLPHMDAMRPVASAGSLTGADPETTAKAFGAGPKAFVGSRVAELARLYNVPDMAGSYLGVMFDSYVTPTNPFPRDSQNRAITFGRLTLGTIRITLADTGGFKVIASKGGVDATTLDFNGFVVGDPGSLIGSQPIISSSFSTYIGGEVRGCKYTIKSKRWLPLTITSLEWAGQLFNHQRRA